MSTNINQSSVVLLLLLYLVCAKCQNIEEALKKLGNDVKSSRSSRDSENISPIWQAYEFGTGAGNREEIVVTNITVYKYTHLPETEVKWQCLEVNGSGYLVSAQKSALSFYRLNFENALTDSHEELKIKGLILTFEIIVLSSSQATKVHFKNDVVVVLCVESDTGTSLEWYRIMENGFQRFWSWPVQKHIKDLKFIQYRDQNRLLLLDSNEMHSGKQHSPIDVYGFNIDFLSDSFNFWICQTILVPKTFDVKVCPIYESISLAIQGIDSVFLYEYRHTSNGSLFQSLQTIKSHDLKNFVCFESGYIQYLAISGPEAGLYNFFENEFQFNAETESNFEIAEISWIKDLRLNTYREESLLLIQLKNSTVIALSWHGSGFKKIELPNDVLDGFDISKITVIPKFGFVVGNRFVRFDTKLRDFRRPIQDETQTMLNTQSSLKNIIERQEEIINGTNARIEKSYFNKPIITGFWNLTNLNATNATVMDDVIYNMVKIGGTNLTEIDLKSGDLVDSYMKKLNEYEKKIEKIASKIKQSMDSNSTDVRWNSDVDVVANMNITGILTVQKLTANFINGDIFINNNKTSSSAETVTTYFNGISENDILFGNSPIDYSNVNFSKINRAVIDGHLSVPIINNNIWDTTMNSVVWKNKTTNISGNTVLKGTLIASDELNVQNINGVLYPNDYVLNGLMYPVNVNGSKTFNTLSVTNLMGINTINDISIEDYLIVDKYNILAEQITFENLIMDGPLKVDGKLVGIDSQVRLLNESTKIFSDIIIKNLKVLGNLSVKDSIAGKEWSTFEDILLKTDANVQITGTKTFQSLVEIGSNVTIRSGRINGHSIDEFVTLNTEQELPNLEKISANVSFVGITLGAIENLEAYLNKSKNASTGCLDKIIIFNSTIALDNMSFNVMARNISAETFSERLNKTFETVYFKNLAVKTLMAKKVVPKSINGVNVGEFVERLSTSNISDEREFDNLEIDILYAKIINGIPLEELKNITDHFGKLKGKILQGNLSLESLLVTGTISTPSINGAMFKDLYNEDKMGTVIFEKDVSIENLRIRGLMNNFNFSKEVSDSIFKTETNIKITGPKRFESINCHELKMESLNGHSLEKILDPDKEQELKGPVIVNGSVTVLKSFVATGNIGDVPFRNLTHRFESLGNNIYEYEGNCRFPDNTSIENLETRGWIREKPFDNFIESVVFKNEDNVTISGKKIFQNSATFNGNLTVLDNLNDLDLKKFQEKAVFIDKPFSIRSKVHFKDVVTIEKNLTIETSFEANTVMGIDIVDLQASILHPNEPEYVLGTMTFTNVTFESNLEIQKMNDLDMNLLLPLHTDQAIPLEYLKGLNITIERMDFEGTINGYYLDTIKRNTFMIFGDQNVTGRFNFISNVYARENFDARRLNGIDPKDVVLLNTKDTLKGNFVFKNLILNQGLRVLGYLNGIDPLQWQAVAIATSFDIQQIVSGAWTVHGDVYFENGAFGSDILNSTNVTQLSIDLAKQNLEIDLVMKEAKLNFANACEDLNLLKSNAENQVYRFSAFDYFQILEFDRKIVSIHYFELKDTDYLLVSYDSCHMQTYQLARTKFVLVGNIPDFGVIDRWATFKHDKVLYFLTSGRNSCGRSPVNLWKLENDELTHILDLGNAMKNKEITHDDFLSMINPNPKKRSMERSSEVSLKSTTLPSTDHRKTNFYLFDNQTILSDEQSIYKYDLEDQRNRSLNSTVGSKEILNFKVGIFEKQQVLIYDEEISKDHVFIYTNGAEQRKIVQTIRVQLPKSFTILNFGGMIETLLVFIENGQILQIYEYQGIQGFVHRDSIRVKVDKLFSFKIRKYTDLERRHCLAVIQENRLIILEAKMYGEKLDISDISCTK